MYNQPFYIPGYMSGGMPGMMRGAFNPGMVGGSLGTAARGTGLFSRLGGALGAFRSIDWGGLINNTSKTLGIINQTIPLVRQVGPMVGNVRSMLMLASVFKDETDSPSNSKISASKTSNMVNKSKNDNSYHDSKVYSDNVEKETYNSYDNYNDSPTFFIN